MAAATLPTLDEAALLLGDVAVEIDAQSICCGAEDYALAAYDEYSGDLYRCRNCGAEFEESEMDKFRREAAHV